MHRIIQDHLEEVLAESNPNSAASVHLAKCRECREEVSAMRQQASLLRALRAPESCARRAGVITQKIRAHASASRPLNPGRPVRRGV